MGCCLLVFLVVSFCVVASSGVPDESIVRAVDVLGESGYISMSLTVELLSKDLLSNASSATIFCPSDDSFSDSGQPSLAHIQLHFSPVAFPFSELQFFPFGANIPTLSPARSLIVTTLPSDNRISINNVKIDGSPIFDDGILIVFGIDDFFAMDFKIASSPPSPSPKIQRIPRISPTPKIQQVDCPLYSLDPAFTQAGDSIRSQGFSVMASFLDLLLVPLEKHDATRFTVFAPVDGALEERLRNFTGWGSLFSQHVVPCQVSLSDLANLVDGPGLTTLMKGFFLNATRSADLLMLNGVPVVLPDIHHADRLIVHGIQDVLLMPQASEDEAAHGFVLNQF